LIPVVGIAIVTFNSERYIKGCLEFALGQTYAAFRVVVIDNDSSDSTVEILRSFPPHPQLRIIYNSTNTGFAGGQNQAIAELMDAEWILALNPDVRIPAEFLTNLVAAVSIDAEVGSVCGKLLKANDSFEVSSPPLLDSTGIYFTPNLRHLDRGNGSVDAGQFEAEEFVFGGTGAACLYRAAMIADISIFGEFFDTDFFAYREDADVAWRAQLLGWKCLYTPNAVALHVRKVVPENRRSLPAAINRHSVKNRWLLRIKNTTADLYLHFLFPITLRDIVVIGGCLLGEWSSLGAFFMLFKLWSRTWRKRHEIMRRKRVTNAYIRDWFSNQAVSFPSNCVR
jgi:GT2 family glycosyltransferase